MIIESSSPGIESNSERKNRFANDLNLAKLIKESEFSDFLNKWYDLEIFNSLRKSQGFEKIINLRLLNDKLEISNNLKNLSLGNQEYLTEKIKDLDLRILLLSGEFDLKYSELNTSLSKKFKNASSIIIQNCGHNIHSENPSLYISSIIPFLNS